MFTLLSGLWKYFFQKDEYCVLILGLDNAGKTTLLEQIKRKYSKSYTGLPFEKITPTVGLNIGKIGISHCKLMFWDLGGQEELQTLWDKYFEECHGLIYVVDSTDERRLEDSHKALERVVQEPSLRGIPLLVLANKQDLEGARGVTEIEDSFKEDLTGSRDCFVQSISALTGDGIEVGIQWLVDQVKHSSVRPPRQKDIT